jgi:IrrE N-terminal-like domain
MPPVPVEDLVSERMDVEEDYFPTDCDAVVFGLTDERHRPRLILNRQRPHARRRFTLAHELGHVLISWHLGTILCQTDLAEYEEPTPDRDSIHWTLEREANAFAAELLMPRPWLEARLAGDRVAEGIADIRIAGVSAAAACFAAIEVLPPGHLLVLLDDSGRARYVFRTSGTDVPTRYRGEEVDRPSLDRLAVDHARIRFGNQVVYWWQFDQATPLVPSDDPRNASELLASILADVASAVETPHLRSRINGIVGSAKNRARGSSPEELHAELRQRFTGRSDLAAVQEHADFPLFLSRKASEISEPS